jgi:hypothetical protein
MRSRCVLLILIAALRGGCSTVSSKVQLGNPAFAKDAQKLAGVWMTPDGHPFFVRHIKDNELRVASVEWSKEESRFELEETTAYFTDDDDRRIINLVDPDSDETSPRFVFVRVIALTDEGIVIILPRVDTFAKAVADGVLPGKIEEKKFGKAVRLEATKEQLDSFVDPAKLGDQFNAESVLPLHRVQGPSVD